MSFRPATAADEALFYVVRNFKEQEGRWGRWFKGNLTTLDEHRVWYADKLQRATLLVWEEHGMRVGVARIESNGEVDFHAAHRSTSTQMLEGLKPYAAQYGGRLKVTLDKGNRAPVRALKDAGWAEYPVRFFCYRP